MKFQSGDKIKDSMGDTFIVVSATLIGSTEVLRLCRTQGDTTIFKSLAYYYELASRKADPVVEQIQKEMRWATKTLPVEKKSEKEIKMRESQDTVITKIQDILEDAGITAITIIVNTHSDILNTIQNDKYLEERHFLSYLLSGMEDKVDPLREITEDHFFVEIYKKAYNAIQATKKERLGLASLINNRDQELWDVVKRIANEEIPESSPEGTLADLKLRKCLYDLKMCSLKDGTDKEELLCRKKGILHEIKKLSKISADASLRGNRD